MKHTDAYSDFIMHYGRKDMNWHKNIFTGETYGYADDRLDASEAADDVLEDDATEYKRSVNDTDDKRDGLLQKVVDSGMDIVMNLFGGRGDRWINQTTGEGSYMSYRKTPKGYRVATTDHRK